MEEGSNGDGDESGGTSPSQQGAETGILVPQNLMDMAEEIGIASGKKGSGIRVSSAGVKIGAKGGPRGATRQSGGKVARPRAGPRQAPSWLPCGSPGAPLWPYFYPRGGNPDSRPLFSRSNSDLRYHRHQVSGTRIPVPAPCRDGEVPPDSSPSPLLPSSMKRE